MLEQVPERYAYHEQKEEVREYLGKDVAIMRDRHGGTTKPMTMKIFRERLPAAPTLFDAVRAAWLKLYAGLAKEGRRA